MTALLRHRTGYGVSISARDSMSDDVPDATRPGQLTDQCALPSGAGDFTFRITPRSTNRAATTAQIEAVGIKIGAFDHQLGAYVGCVLPAGTGCLWDLFGRHDFFGSVAREDA